MTGSLYEVDDFGEGSYIQWKTSFYPQWFGIRPLAVVIQLMRNSYSKHLVRIISVLQEPKDYLNFKSFRKHAKKLIKPCRYRNFRMVCVDACRCSFVEFIWMEWIGKRNSGSVEQSGLASNHGFCTGDFDHVCGYQHLVDIIYAYLDPKIRLS
jgi:peptide/nickel transport system permease protein